MGRVVVVVTGRGKGRQIDGEEGRHIHGAEYLRYGILQNHMHFKFEHIP